MPTSPFRGFDSMSVYVVFSFGDTSGFMNGDRIVGILLTRDERSDRPAELFQPKIVGATGNIIEKAPKLIKKVDVRDVCVRSDLQLRTAIKLNKDPLDDYELKGVSDVLGPLSPYRPGTQVDWLTEIFECLFESSKFHYMRRVETATAQKVVELGNDLDQNRNVSECRVFECWEMPKPSKKQPKEQPEQPKEQPKEPSKKQPKKSKSRKMKKTERKNETP
ncbi:hypothetical protein DFH11DRAFT_1880225 [Phellopilus nigrolimitatus]|nr:hypothetical protein DFH11DRAFT_1880225 [Phellopilus nigrolimitatus]